MKVVCVFRGETRFHDAALARSVIALKLIFRSKVNVIIISDQVEYLQAAHGAYNHLYPITLVRPENASAIPLRGESIGFVTEGNQEDKEFMEGLGCEVVVVPNLVTKPLSFQSVVFGETFTFPQFSFMKSVLEQKGLVPEMGGLLLE